MMRVWLAAILALGPGAPARASGDWRERVTPVESAADLERLADLAAGARLVLLGEASHGTSEFYSRRADLSLRLIERHAYDFVVVEGDWAACYEVNKYVKGLPGAGPNAREVLRAAFQRWPQWMWANEETAEFIERLRALNQRRPPAERAGFYGKDVYDHPASMDRVIAYVRRRLPKELKSVTEAYACLERHRADPWGYTRSLTESGASCEAAVVSVTELLNKNAVSLSRKESKAYFQAIHNAIVVQNAERYYRESVRGGSHSWNSRVSHMTEIVRRLLERHGKDSRGIVWAHNTHVGDARATAMTRFGQTNIGQLKRESLGHENVFALGFGTAGGTVAAGTSWGSPRADMRLPPLLAGTYEHRFAALHWPAFYFLTKDFYGDPDLAGPAGHRAIGVVYNPDAEHGNYVPTRLLERYDAFLFIRDTRALTPL